MIVVDESFIYWRISDEYPHDEKTALRAVSLGPIFSDIGYIFALTAVVLDSGVFVDSGTGISRHPVFPAKLARVFPVAR